MQVRFFLPALLLVVAAEAGAQGINRRPTDQAQREPQPSAEEAGKSDATRKLVDSLSHDERIAYIQCKRSRKGGIAPDAQQCIEEAKARVADANAEKAEEDAVIDNFKACVESGGHKLALAARHILGAREEMDDARAALERDKAIEASSGVIDLNLRHQAGAILVDKPKSIESYFAQYKALGGSAGSADAVVQTPDPCAQWCPRKAYWCDLGSDGVTFP